MMRRWLHVTVAMLCCLVGLTVSASAECAWALWDSD